MTKAIKSLPWNAIVELPSDAIEQGYVETKPFHYEQLFYSPSNNFKGTEKEFYYAGICGAYTIGGGGLVVRQQTRYAV
jgi:hypothetical protein